VIEFQRATEPLPGILDDLIIGGAENPELQRYLRDVQDHALRITEQVASFRELLQNILSVNLTLVSLAQNEEVKVLSEASIDQNEEVKKISAWAAILFAPTLVGTVYGMNFNHMPELHWLLGYPFALLLMLLVSVSLYLVFKRRGWL
jgi:magnesium transporter